MFTRRFAESIELAMPAPYAFGFLADVSRCKEIDPCIIDYTSDPFPLQVGSRNSVHFRMWGLEWRLQTVVEEYVQDRRMVFRQLKPSWPVRGMATHWFEPTSAGCIYTWSMELAARDPLGVPFAFFGNRSFRAIARRQQQRFKAVVERYYQASPVVGSW